MSVEAVIEISVAVYIVSEKENNIIAAWLLALLLQALGLWWLVTWPVSVCMSGNQCTSVYSCILVGVWDRPVLSIPDPSLVSSLVNKQGLC